MKKNVLKIFIIVIFAASVFLGVFLLSGCNNGDSSAYLKDKHNVYGFMAVSGVQFLSDSNIQNVSYNENKTDFIKMSSTVTEQEQIDEIHKYLKIFDDFFGNEKPVKTEIAESDKEGFTSKMIITVDNAISSQNFTMYFNETPLNDNNDGDEEQDNEIETKLSGIMIMNGTEYEISGKRELEGDEAEIEFTAKIDDSNYIVIKQEIENEEQEFVYKLYTDNVLVDKVSIEIETENNETELEIKTLKNGTETRYEFEKEIKDNKEVIDMYIVENGIRTKMKVTIEEVNGEKVYNYLLNEQVFEKHEDD